MIVKKEFLVGRGGKVEQVGEAEAIAIALRMLGLHEALDKLDNRVMVCDHIASGQWRGTIDQFHLPTDVAATFALPGKTWSGTINTCAACAKRADEILTKFDVNVVDGKPQ